MIAATMQEAAVRRLRKRAEFVRTARGSRVGRSAFSLQCAARDLEEPGLGFTVTKQQGNSPERNRIRRRLRAAAEACSVDFQTRHDYVLIGRREALGIDFARLVAELASSINKIHARNSR